ncbi:MAG: alkaline phosphatase family protein, partial [Ginsengibacter sp.]
DFGSLVKIMNDSLAEKFGEKNLIVQLENYQVYLNLPVITTASLKIDDIKKRIINYLSNQPGVQRVIDLDDLDATPLNSTIKTRIVNGYYPARSGQIQLILQPGWIEGYRNEGTTHGEWNPYDAHIPLLWYGWGIKHGVTNREVHMTDIASTLAALLHIQMPSGCVGSVIEEVLK